MFGYNEDYIGSCIYWSIFDLYTYLLPKNIYRNMWNMWKNIIPSVIFVSFIKSCSVQHAVTILNYINKLSMLFYCEKTIILAKFSRTCLYLLKNLIICYQIHRPRTKAFCKRDKSEYIKVSDGSDGHVATMDLLTGTQIQIPDHPQSEIKCRAVNSRL